MDFGAVAVNDRAACSTCGATSSGDLHEQLAKLVGCIDQQIPPGTRSRCEAVRTAVLSGLVQRYGPQAVERGWARALRDAG